MRNKRESVAKTSRFSTKQTENTELEVNVQANDEKTINAAAQKLASKADWRWDEGQLEEAADYYEQALDIAPDYIYARLSLARILFELGERDEATDHLESIDITQEENIDQINEYGILLLDLGFHDDAMEIFELVAGRDPTYGEAYANMGVILRERGDLDAAIEAFQEFLKYTDNPEQIQRAREDISDLQRQLRRSQPKRDLRRNRPNLPNNRR
jgi:tetratricopeptide (TPR) repeat protein